VDQGTHVSEDPSGINPDTMKQMQNREVGLFNRGGGGRSIFCRGRFFICPVVVFPCERCGFVPTNNRKQQTKIENWRS